MEPAITYSNLGLPQEWYGALGWVFPTWARTHALDTGEAVNFLKGAIVTADRIVTVSKVIILHITYFASCCFIYLNIGVFVNYSNFSLFLIVDTQSTSF